MSYLRVHDVLDRVRDFHHRLGERAADVESKGGPNWTEPLVELARGHVDEFENGLAEYEQEGAKSVLDTWVQYVPDGEAERELQEFELDPGASPEDAVEHALRFDQELRELYASLAQASAAPQVSELFQRLEESAQRRTEQFAWKLRDAPGSEEPGPSAGSRPSE